MLVNQFECRSLYCIQRQKRKCFRKSFTHINFHFQIAQQQNHQYQRPLYEYKNYNYSYNINQYNHSKNNFSNYKKPYCTSAYTDYPEKPIKMQREEIIIEHSQLVLNGNGATNENVGHHRSHHYTQVNDFYC